MKILDKNKIVPYLKEQFGKFLSTVKDSKGKPVNEIAKSILGTFFGRAICIVCGVLVVGTIGLSTGIGKSNKASDFVLIPAGTFQMGSNQGYDDNKPVHTVTLTKAFYMCDHEVTQAEYEAVMGEGSNPSYFVGDDEDKKVSEGEVQENRPVEQVSWYMAIVYCNKRSIKEGLTPCYTIGGKTDPAEWGTVPTSSDATWNKVECNWTVNGYRLPTEAEWEYAARAGDATVDALTWSGTNAETSLGDYAWYSSNAGSKTHEVKKKSENAKKLYDMSGNVWEWCWDWWPASGKYSADAATDPRGDTSGSNRVRRGGCYTYGSGNCAVSCRWSENPWGQFNRGGFRVCRSSVSKSPLVKTTADKKMRTKDSSAEVKTESSDKKEAKTVKNKSNGKKNYGKLGMVKIPAGTFQMGSNQGFRPVHTVTISKPFYMCDHEVTKTEYEAVMETNPWYDETVEDGEVCGNRPRQYVSWYEAIVYCNKRSIKEGLTPCYTIIGETEPSEWGSFPETKREEASWNLVECNWNADGYRLPTEAEWEYAARAGDNTVDVLTWSGTKEKSSLGDYAWYSSNADEKAHEVKKKKPNAWGLYDMSGNVWEWCWDWWSKKSGVSADEVTDPRGETTGSDRVICGGGFYDKFYMCDVATMQGYDPSDSYASIGFRVCRSIVSKSSSVRTTADKKAGKKAKTVDVKSNAKKNNVALDMVKIPAGTFEGQPIEELYMYDHEVTQAEFEAIMGTNPSYFKTGVADGEVQEKRPVDNVSWYMAIVYCNKRSIKEGLTPCYSINEKTDLIKWGVLPTTQNDVTWDAIECNWNADGYRLPTEAEWEYAARAGDNTVDVLTWSGTNTESNLGEYAWNGWRTTGNKTHEVKTKKPNVWGLYDMSGNVWEWCWDGYGSYTYIDPRGVEYKQFAKRVMRGGSFQSDCEVTSRFGNYPGDMDCRHGFRVCRTAN